MRAFLTSGFRSIRASPRNTAAVTLALTVAAGASQAVWSIWNVIVERPLPFPQAAEVVELVPAATHSGSTLPVIYGEELRFLQQEASSFRSLAGWTTKRSVLGSQTGAREVRIAEVDVGLLDMLQIAPALGRSFGRGDHRLAEVGGQAIVLGHRLWRTAFGGSPQVIGEQTELDGRLVRIIGVMPRHFVFPTPAHEAWLPAPERVPLPMKGMFTLRSVNPVGRLHAGVSPIAAANEVSALLGRAGLPAVLERDTLRITAPRLMERVSASVLPALTTLQFGAVLLLIVAVVGASALRASLSLRGWRDAGIRSALGASWKDALLSSAWRVTLLAAMVGLASTAVSVCMYPLFRPFVEDFAVIEPFGIDWPVIGGGFLLALFVVALAEALSSAATHRLGRGRPLGKEPTFARRPHAAPGFVAVGTGASTILLVGTTLLGTGAWRVLQGAGAYSGKNLVHLTVDFGGHGDGAPAPYRTSVDALDRLVQRLTRIPGVEAAGYADHLPDRPAGSFLSGESVDGDSNARLILRLVSPTLLGVLGIPVVRGRGITATDAPPGEAVAVADRSLVRRLGGREAVGQLVGSGLNHFRIVGIVPDVEVFPPPMARASLYAHFRQAPHTYRPSQAQVAVRFTSTPSDAQLAVLRRAPPQTDGALRLLRIETAAQRRSGLLESGLLTAVAVGIFAIAGMLLSFVGMLGQIANEISQKSHSLAIRRALGAAPNSVAWQAVREVAIAALIGNATGLATSWVLARFFLRRMPWVEIGDPLLYLAPSGLLGLAAILGCLAGSLFTRRGDPWRALQTT